MQGGPAKVATLSGPAKVATFLAQQKWLLFGNHIKCSFHPLKSGPFLSNTRTVCGLVASMIMSNFLFVAVRLGFFFIEIQYNNATARWCQKPFGRR